VAKTATYLLPKGEREQQHVVSKAGEVLTSKTRSQSVRPYKVKSGLIEPKSRGDRTYPTGCDANARIRCEGDTVVVLLKLSSDPACREQETTKWAPKYWSEFHEGTRGSPKHREVHGDRVAVVPYNDVGKGHREPIPFREG